MSRGEIVMAVGGLLIVVGVLLVVAQGMATKWPHHNRSANVRFTGISLRTTYPGIIVIAIGAIMMTGGAALT